ncbi:MAG: hypothetical protein O7H41_02690 [Planctomycetota bacterium]|nr:hypothetical protein [Planctomycetota bacterium]
MKVNPSLACARSGIAVVTMVGALLFLTSCHELTESLTSGEGVELVYRLPGASASQVDKAIDVIQKRLEQFEPVKKGQVIVSLLRPQEISVKLPDLKGSDLERAKKFIEMRGDLHFMIVSPRQDAAKIAAILGRKADGSYNPDDEKLDIALRRIAEGNPLPTNDAASYSLVERNEALSGEMISKVYATTDIFGNSAIGFEWDAEGARLFGKLTGRNKGRNLVIVLDGVILSATMIQEKITRRGIMTGRFTGDDVNNIVVVLGLKKLPVKPTLLKESPWRPDTNDRSHRGEKRGTEK